MKLEGYSLNKNFCTTGQLNINKVPTTVTLETIGAYGTRTFLLHFLTFPRYVNHVGA